MPSPYSLDLRWRIIYAYLTQNLDTAHIAQVFSVCERTVKRYIELFEQTGEVQSLQASHGPKPLLDRFEQLTLLHLILKHPGIYLKEIQDKLEHIYGVSISVSTICRTLKRMGCTRQSMYHIALQRSDSLRANFIAEISIFDPNMLVWVDESGCDRRNTVRKYGYSIRGIPLCDQRLLVRGTRYSAIPIISTLGVHDVYLAEGTIDGHRFAQFVESCLLPVLNPFNGINPCSVVIMDNASIHHVDENQDLIEGSGARLIFLPPYSPDLNPVEGVFSQVKRMMKENHTLFEVTSCTRTLLSMLFGIISQEDCIGHISHSGYI